MAYDPDPDDDDYDAEDDPASQAKKKLKVSPISKGGTAHAIPPALKSKSKNKVLGPSKDRVRAAVVGEKCFPKSNVGGDEEDDADDARELGYGRGKEEEEEEDEVEEVLEMDLAKSSMNADKMVKLLAQFTPDQMTRYEAYRRASFLKANMRRMIQNIAGSNVPPNLTIVFSGIAKIFVGELTETGRVVMEERGDVGPIRPTHIREAYRRLKETGKVPMRRKPPLFH